MGRISQIILWAILLFVAAGCSETFEESHLPIGATNVKQVGTCWYTFDYDGRKFLIYERNLGYNNGVVTITELSK